MILQFIRRDLAWKFTPWLTVAAAIAAPFGSWLHASPFIPVLAAPIYLIVFMASLPHQRVTFFEAALPVSGRDLLLARFLSLMSLVWLPAIAAAAGLLLAGREAKALPAIAAISIVMTLAILAVLSVRVKQFAGPSWLTVCGASVVAPSLVLALSYGHAVPVAAVGAVAALALGWRTWNSVPEAFQSAPMEVSSERKKAGRAAPSLPWWPIIRSVFLWQSAIFIPISLIWAASGDWLFAPMYMMMGYSQSRLTTRWSQALPISRRAILAAATIPLLLALAAGAEVGMLTGQSEKYRRPIQQGDPGNFRASGTLDVVVDRAFWKLAPNGNVPVTQAPWGESFQPPPQHLLGLTFYNPYAVGQHNSWNFEDWQFARATTVIYGTPMTAREMAEGEYGSLVPITRRPRMQVLTTAAFVASGLLCVWFVELLSWHRLGRLSSTVRHWLTTTIALIPIVGIVGLDVLVGKGLGSISRPALTAALLFISTRLPSNLMAVAAIALIPLLALFWIVDRQADASEVSQKVQEVQSLVARFGSRP